MHDTVDSRDFFVGAATPPEVEKHLLDLFAPKRVPNPRSLHSSHDRAELWHSDALHRANNVAQLFNALAYVARRNGTAWATEEILSEMHKLARIYQRLGRQSPRQEHCSEILREVATSLLRIFGRERHIKGDFQLQDISLPFEKLRALVLICSELLINSLKYGYPNERAGCILVTLKKSRDNAELVVEDDGVGLGEQIEPGQGRGLIDQLCKILDAKVATGTNARSTGHRVLVSVPLQLLP